MNNSAGHPLLEPVALAYHRIGADLVLGGFRAGDQYRPEWETAARLGIHRSSVRRAYVRRVAEGVLATRRRRTYVAALPDWSGDLGVLPLLWDGSYFQGRFRLQRECLDALRRPGRPPPLPLVAPRTLEDLRALLDCGLLPHLALLLGWAPPEVPALLAAAGVVPVSLEHQQADCPSWLAPRPAVIREGLAWLAARGHRRIAIVPAFRRETGAAQEAALAMAAAAELGLEALCPPVEDQAASSTMDLVALARRHLERIAGDPQAVFALSDPAWWAFTAWNAARPAARRVAVFLGSDRSPGLLDDGAPARFPTVGIPRAGMVEDILARIAGRTFFSGGTVAFAPAVSCPEDRP